MREERIGRDLGHQRLVKSVIIRHPNGDPQDMQHTEDALWASLAKAAGKATNPCAAR